MEDYRTRRLDAGSEEPEPEEEEQEEAAPVWGAPPPLLPEEDEMPPALPPQEAAPPPFPEPKDATPPALPEEEADPGSPAVFYQAPSEQESAGGGETVVSPMGWNPQSEAEEPRIPSPFEEPVITPQPVSAHGESEPRRITPEPITPGMGGSRPASPPPGPGAPAKKNNTPLIIGIVVAVLLLLCCCCVLAFGLLSASGDWQLGWIGAVLSSLLL